MRLLYQYKKINNHTIENLIAGQWWLSSPSDFNDPFEFRLQEPDSENLGDIKGLKEFRLSQPKADKLSDYELVKGAKDIYQKEINSYKVGCFTEFNDNLLMWSHYANSHMGICLEFEFDKEPHEYGVNKIKYQEDYPEIILDKIWSIDGLAKILYTKSNNWSYEQEWRLIVTNLANGGNSMLYTAKLVSVIFGARVQEVDKNKIIEILKGKNIEIKRAVLNKNKYALNIVAD